MNRIQLGNPAIGGAGLWLQLVQTGRSGLDTLSAEIHAAIDRHRQRQALARLDQRLLRDIGISAEQAREEARKPPWRC